MTRPIPLPSDVQTDLVLTCRSTLPPWRMVFPVWDAVRRDWRHWQLRRQLSEVAPWFCATCGIDLLANPSARLTLVGVPSDTRGGTTLAPRVQCDCGHKSTLTRDGLAVMAMLR